MTSEQKARLLRHMLDKLETEEGGSRLFLRVGRRGATLLLLAALDVFYGYSMFTADPKDKSTGAALLYTNQIVFPAVVWGTLWIGVALILAVSAFRHDDRLGFGAGIAIKTMWGTLWLVATITGQIRLWTGAVVWLLIAVWLAVIATWPEPTRTYRQMTRDIKAQRQQDDASDGSAGSN